MGGPIMSVVIRTLPSLVFEQCDLRAVPAIVTSSTERRVTERAVIGEELTWQLSATSAPISGRREAEMIDQLQVFAEFCSIKDVFAAFDLSQPRPRAYPSALSDGEGIISSISDQGKTVRVRNLQGGLILNRGCLIEFRRSDDPLVRSLHRVASDAVATAAGTIEEVRLVSGVNTDVFGALDLAIVEKPSTLMQIDSFSLPRRYGSTVFTFSASEWMSS